MASVFALLLALIDLIKQIKSQKAI